MKRVDVTAASPAPLVICDCVPTFRGGAWSREGVILFAPNPASAILRVPAAGGSPVPVTMLDARMETLHRFPSFLPDGRHFLYMRLGKPEFTGIYLGSLDAKPQQEASKRLLATAYMVEFVTSPGGNSGMDRRCFEHSALAVVAILRREPANVKKPSE